MCNCERRQSRVQSQLQAILANLRAADYLLTDVADDPAVLGHTLDPEDSIPALRLANVQQQVQDAMTVLRTVPPLIALDQTASVPALVATETR